MPTRANVHMPVKGCGINLRLYGHVILLENPMAARCAIALTNGIVARHETYLNSATKSGVPPVRTPKAFEFTSRISHIPLTSTKPNFKLTKLSKSSCRVRILQFRTYLNPNPSTQPLNRVILVTCSDFLRPLLQVTSKHIALISVPSSSTASWQRQVLHFCE